MGSERIVGTRLDSDSAEEVSGIVPSSLVDIFRKINMRKQSPTERDEQWIVKVGYLEVYNEQILCLLKPGRPLRVCEDPAKGFVQVAGLEERIVNSSDEVLDLLREGNANRKTEATMANQVSSRSHAVLQVSVTRKYTDSYGQDAVREAKLCLIDLAGSERASATNNSGALLRQGANINKSLLSLANCINALAHNSRRQSQSKSNVKYRDSKLTHLLKASLEGNCRVVMIANINVSVQHLMVDKVLVGFGFAYSTACSSHFFSFPQPSHITYEDTHNTLKYANRAKNIKIAPRKTLGVEDVPWPVREARLLKENAELRDANVELQSEIETLRQQAGEIKPLEDSSVKRRRVSVSEQDVSDTIATLEDHLYKLKAERSDLQAQLLRVRTEKNDLYVKMEELQQVQETQSSNVNAAKPNPRLVEDLEKQLHKKDADIHHLQEENDKLREDMWQAIAQTRHADMMDEGDTSILEKIKEENERLRGQLIAAGDAPDYSSTILKLGDDCSRHQQRADKLETRVQELEQIRTLLLNELAQALPPQQKAAPASIQTPEKDEFQFEQSNAYSPFQVGSPDMAPPSKRGGAVKSRSRRSSFIPRPARRGADENDAGCDAVEEKLQTNTLARRTRSRLSLVPIRSTRLD